MTTEKSHKIKKILNQVESVLHRPLRTPQDFDFASEVIEYRTRVRLSHTTLMRLWGYVREPVEPRNATLGVLAKFCGYESWEKFVESDSDTPPCQSDPVLSRGIVVERDIKAGDELTITWDPGRKMCVRHNGECRFTVTHSQLTRLVEGTTFTCFMIIENEPLFVNEVNINGNTLPAYVCGRNTGVRISRKE